METDTCAYHLLTLTALSGESSADILSYMGVGPSYGEKLITKLKEEGYIKTHYKDRLRGYRLTSRAKKLLLSENPDRFSFYLSGNTDTNRPRSDYPRRLRLQQTSIVYAMLIRAGVQLYRDKKPLLFQGECRERFKLDLPVFYQAKEIKELGAETVKINNSRTMGVLFTPKCIYAVFYTGDSLMKWEYRTELKVKTMLQYYISRGILSKDCISPWYHPDTPVKALVIGKDMDTALKLMNSRGGYQKSYFCLDASFEYFHYVPAEPAGETLLKVLCSLELQESLKKLLVSDLQPPDSNLGLEHDAMSDGVPVLVAFEFDMLRITRFATALALHELYGNLICFDFQKPVLMEYFGESVMIETIDLSKFERRFLN